MADSYVDKNCVDPYFTSNLDVPWRCHNLIGSSEYVRGLLRNVLLLTSHHTKNHVHEETDMPLGLAWFAREQLNRDRRHLFRGQGGPPMKLRLVDFIPEGVGECTVKIIVMFSLTLFATVYEFRTSRTLTTQLQLSKVNRNLTGNVQLEMNASMPTKKINVRVYGRKLCVSLRLRKS